MIAADTRALAGRFAGASVLIVGDVMLDHFLVGRVERISPEAPVPVVTFREDEYRLGGAANVAHGIRALGGQARLAGLVGEDDAAARLCAALEAIGVSRSGLVRCPGRPTTRKLRIVTTRNQQVARVDYEIDADVEGDRETELARSLERDADGAACIVVSDYLKGAITRRIATAAVALGRARGIPVLVDPKIPHIDYYAGATLITPNHHEAEIATHLRIRSADEARQAAQAFRRLARCESVLITRGEHGMWLLDGSAGGGTLEQEIPAAAREVADVTGAGDTVIATLALALAAGAPLGDAARLANEAAGMAVGKFGPATVTPEELFGSGAGTD